MADTMLVTGGAGFIGSNFIFHMLSKYRDLRLICLDKLTYAGNLSTLREALEDPRLHFVRADICDRKAVFQLFEEQRPDTVVNFAAESHVDRSIENPGIFLNTNVYGVSVLMDACCRYGVKRYHQVSTDEVYGDLPLAGGASPFAETAPLRASSPYSASKAAADLLVLAYHRTYGLPVTISRSGNNYGPYQFPEKLIPLMLISALKNKTLPVYGDGENIRDWIYVEDHCRAIELILRCGRAGEVYNVGSSCEMSNINLVRLLLKELGKPESLVTFVADRRGHDLRCAVDASKIRLQLGWRPETSFLDSIRKTVRWYLGHRTWWSEIISGDYRKYYESMYGPNGTHAQGAHHEKRAPELWA